MLACCLHISITAYMRFDTSWLVVLIAVIVVILRYHNRIYNEFLGISRIVFCTK